jgi:DNA-binding transcriptional regulator YiaG
MTKSATLVTTPAPVFFPSGFLTAPKPYVKADSVSWSPAQAMQLKALRMQRGLSQQKLADQLGMTRRRLSNVEWPSPSNPTRPTKTELAALTGFFSK